MGAFLKRSVYFFSLFCLLITSPYLRSNEVVYPGFERDNYNILLLKHALSYHPDKHYQVTAFGADIPKSRAFELMAANDGIDVMIGTGTKPRVAAYQAIHFPILKGLNGLRIPLINRGQPDKFRHVTEFEQLLKLSAGQFHTWSDTKILKHNGITVADGTDVEGLYTMLHKNRFDYFPRSIVEIQSDLQSHNHLNLMIDPYVVLQYPSAFYYFVRKGNDALADDIKSGLEAALKDGSFDRIFNRFYGKAIVDLKLKDRRIFYLDNPILSKQTPIHRAELWLNPPVNTESAMQ